MKTPAELIVDRLVEIGFPGFAKFSWPVRNMFAEVIRLCIANEWILVVRKFGDGECEWSFQAVQPKTKTV